MVKSLFFSALSFLLFLSALTSCSKEDATFKIGEKYLDVSTNVCYTDTFSVHSYTVKLDSIMSSGLGEPSIVVGQYSDPEFGNVISQSYYRYVLPTNFKDIPSDAVYDSAVLFLLYNGYYAGDTTQKYTMNVHQLQKKMKEEDDGYFYNNGSIDYDPDILGSVTFKPEPIGGDTIWIKLNDNFGSELFGHLVLRDDVTDNNTNFLYQYKGFLLDYGDPSNAILGFSFPSGSDEEKNPALRLYYHYYKKGKQKKHVDFLAYDKQFNHFDITGTPVVDFPTKQRGKLAASKTNEKTYVMAGVGILTRVEIPYLKNLFNLSGHIRIMNATLELEPVIDSYRKFDLPDSLCLYTTDLVNRFVGVIKNAKGNTLYGNLQIDKLYQEDTHYTFDITNYLQSSLITETDDVPTLLVTVPPDNLYKTVERTVLASEANGTNEMRLILYYMIYE